MRLWESRPWPRYAAAIGIVIVAAAVRLVFLEALGTRAPYMTFYPAVMIVTLFCGLPAGFLATFLSAIIAAYFWIEPVNQLIIKDSGDWLGLIAFILSSFFVAYLSGVQRRAQLMLSEADTQLKLFEERKEVEIALRSSAERLKMALAASRMGVWEWNVRLNSIFWSPECSEIIDSNNFSGSLESLTNVIHPDDADRVIAAAQQALVEKKYYSVEFRIFLSDGQVRWLSTLARPMYDENENPLHLIGTVQDISERKVVEQALRESEELHRSLFENMLNGFAYCRMLYEGGEPKDFIYLAVNDAFESLTGLGNVVGRKVTEVIPGIREADPKLFEAYSRVATTGQPERFETFVGALQMWFWISVYSPQPEHFVAVFDVITERKSSEEALRKSEEHHRTILQTAMDGILLVDIEGRLLEVNDAYVQMSGYSSQELLSMRISDLEAVETARETEDHIQKIMAHGEHRFESRHRRKDGSILGVEISVQNLRSEGNLLVAFLHDITERKLAEEEKSKLEAQLHQAQKMESVGRLDGGLAHDFNNMLSVILGHAGLALRESVPGQSLHSHLTEITKAAERSADLTRQLLTFARKQAIEPKVLDLNETVAGMFRMLQRLIGEDIQLKWQPAPNLWPVKMDTSQIDQILANLCVNARDSITDVGKIVIETSNCVIEENYCANNLDFVPGDYVQLAVSDDGCGMDKDLLKHIFEPFFTTKDIGKGTGLGLATVYGIIKQNNGFINVYSEPGLGTTFTIYMPRHVGTVAQAQTVDATEPLQFGKETILLVEDEPAILNMATMLLSNLGYTVLRANGPNEAIRLAQENAGEIHLLLSDVVMPEMNGLDLSKKLLSLYPQIKQLFMSGYTSDVIAHHGVLDGGLHFIHKPFSLPALTAKIREVLNCN